MEVAVGRLLDFLCVSVYFGFWHIKNRHILSGKHAQKLYADFYMPPNASDCTMMMTNSDMASDAPLSTDAGHWALRRC